jgi:hypothetical protein
MRNTPSGSSRSPLLLLAALPALLLLALPTLAFAQIGDPLGIAAASADGGISLLVTYGPVVGSMYLAYAWASRLVARRAESSTLAAWFSRGKRLAIATGTLGIAGAALQAQVTGGPWTVIAMAAVAAFFKLITPTVNATPSATSRSSQAGHTRPMMMLGLALAGGWTALVLHAGCAATQAKIESVAHGTVVCVKTDIPAGKALGLQLATAALASVFAGHGVPWEQLEDEAAAAAKVHGVAVGSCAFGDLIADLARLLPAPSSSGSTEAFGAVARTNDPLAGGRRALESLKVRLGVTSIDTGAGVF